MTATFGKLQGCTLELKDGLNILQSPNESGKSTWCAFLLSMLYGINSRERERIGFIPDKIRYAPWSGTPMNGRLECFSCGQELSITRTTRRQTSPMGEFQAVYTGTGDSVPNLTGTTCGETLLGVNREVFERSAFIRQSGLAISQDASLERRIASLITAGEENTSYSEAADTLKRQLNRRRHNKTGRLPALEAELQEIRQQIRQSEQLELQLTDIREKAERLALREADLANELAQHDRWEATLRKKTIEEAAHAAQQAKKRFATLQQHLETTQAPESETIIRLRGAIVNLETTRKNVEKARDARDASSKKLLHAEAAVNESPFAGQTPDAALRETKDAQPRYRFRGIAAVLSVLAALTLGGGTYTFFVWRWAAYTTGILSGAGIFLAVALVLYALSRHASLQKHRTTLQKRFGTSDPEQIAAMADTYMKLCETRDIAQAEATKCSASAEALYTTLSSNEQAILLEIRRFAPTAFDVVTADSLLREFAAQRKALLEAETAAKNAQMRYELLSQQAPALSEYGWEAVPPTRRRDVVSAELAETQASLAAARSAVDRLTGQLNAVGDPVVLKSSSSHLEDQISALEKEYTAIGLAMVALDSANTTLQNRFSPELGRRAAEIFRELTGDRYDSVVLDRAFHLSAEPQGDAIYRDVALLSAGTADQLYLSVRLAICDLVLPEKHTVPIILDDALANFDDQRCASALRWLKRAAKTRQILLFTCHSREAEFFANDSEVFIQQLTESV